MAQIQPSDGYTVFTTNGKQYTLPFNFIQLSYLKMLDAELTEVINDPQVLTQLDSYNKTIHDITNAFEMHTNYKTLLYNAVILQSQVIKAQVQATQAQICKDCKSISVSI